MHERLPTMQQQDPGPRVPSHYSDTQHTNIDGQNEDEESDDDEESDVDDLCCCRFCRCCCLCC